MPGILNRIDNAIAGDVCPCGAQPRDGSPYCSYDCEPTHAGAHTTSDRDGTQMRWRPDLVIAADDHDLLDLGTCTFYEGRYNARLYQRGIPPEGEPVTWHLRLDDGNRFVGLDLPDVGDILNTEHGQRVADAWARLERELGDRRHTEPDDPWADVFNPDRLRAQIRPRMTDEHLRRICAWLRANSINPDDVPRESQIIITAGTITVEEVVRDGAGAIQVDQRQARTVERRHPLVEAWPTGLPHELATWSFDVTGDNIDPIPGGPHVPGMRRAAVDRRAPRQLIPGRQ
jgi:hypothetical protein